MTVITHPQPQKPQKQQKSGSTHVDQQRSTPHGGVARLPQKQAQPPHKSTDVPPARPGAEAPGDFCGTSRPFRGTTPQHPNSPGQSPGSRTSADSAVSAARTPVRTTERSALQQPTSTEVFTVPEVMAALRLSRFKVYDLIRSGKLPSFTEGRSRRVPVDSLATYIRNKMEGAA